MVAETRLFIRFGLMSFAGLLFYYLHLYFGLFSNALLFKALAVMFLLSTVPLPIIAVNNKKLFPQLGWRGKQVLMLASVLLLVHHFMMTFVFVMFLPDGNTL
jgi:hypothetical protein